MVQFFASSVIFPASSERLVTYSTGRLFRYEIDTSSRFFYDCETGSPTSFLSFKARAIQITELPSRMRME